MIKYLCLSCRNAINHQHKQKTMFSNTAFNFCYNPKIMQNLKYNLMRGDCLKLLKEIESDSVDAIVTDPPYQYLNTKRKNCEFDKPYNEEVYIEEVKRILKPTGFIVMFGRGGSFYRQGVLLDDAGFKFKEEVIWDKRKLASPVNQLGRQHETCFIFAKSKKGVIRKTQIPYIEYMKSQEIPDAIAKIKNHIRVINREIGKPEIFKDIMLYLNENVENYVINTAGDNNLTHRKGIKHLCYSVQFFKTIIQGYKEKDIMRIPEIIEEASIRNANHPTEKPVRLMERLIALVTDEEDLVLDTFMGSGSTGVACLNTNRRFIGMELDEVYFATAQKRMNEASIKVI